MVITYYINEDKCKLLDYYELQTYLTETIIENLASLKQINKLCIKIHNLWNDDLKGLGFKELKKPFVINRENNGKSIIFLEFYAIYLSELEFHHCTSENEKKHLILNNCKKYDLKNIIFKCRNIRNILTSFYPSLRQEEDPKQHLIQYKNSKRLEFSIRPYNISEYQKMNYSFNLHVNDCRYVFMSLDEREREGFKIHIIKNLNAVKNVQVLSEFKTLLSNTISSCNNNFNKKNSLKAPQQPTEIDNKTDKNLHDNIFKDKAFEIWKVMFEKLKIEEKDCTPTRFVFQAMKKDNLIHDTVKVVDFTNWINDTYEIAMNKLPFTDINSNSYKDRMTIYKEVKSSYIN